MQAAVLARLPLRWFLFIPATRLDWVGKAARHKPDAVIPDLAARYRLAVPPAATGGR